MEGHLAFKVGLYYLKQTLQTAEITDVSKEDI
jgi:hypothetical protein